MPEGPHTTTNHRRRGRRSNLLIVAGVLAVLAVAVGYAAWEVLTVPAEEAVALAKPQAAAQPEGATETPVDETVAVEADLIDDDGKTLWVSPTHGPPLDLAYLPPGVEIILALRPAELLAHPEGPKVIAALGPWAEAALQSIEATSGTDSQNFDRLVIGIRSARDDLNAAAKVLMTKMPIEPTLETIQPDAGKGRIMLMGSTGYLMGWRQLKPTSPPLSRDLERLVRHTDADRTVTLIARPASLTVDGGNLFHGEFAPLRAEMENLFSDDVAAMSVSLDWHRDFFVELLAVPTLDSSPQELSDRLANWMQQLPEAVEERILKLNPATHSRRVVARLPEMLRKLAAYTRHGYDQDCAILRCYLPAAAGHNLIMGAELALAERGGTGGGRVGVRPLAEASLPGSIVERLQQKTSLRFGREELEAALDMLADDVGVEIVIRGPDLQLDGITRNQLFAIDMSDRSGEEILVEILRRANPDKLATGPADPRQKLVYVVGPDSIFITTRAGAAARGEALPAVFQEK
jgi:hypothetical protein